MRASLNLSKEDYDFPDFLGGSHKGIRKIGDVPGCVFFEKYLRLSAFV